MDVVEFLFPEALCADGNGMPRGLPKPAVPVRAGRLPEDFGEPSAAFGRNQKTEESEPRNSRNFTEEDEDKLTWMNPSCGVVGKPRHNGAEAHIPLNPPSKGDLRLPRPTR